MTGELFIKLGKPKQTKNVKPIQTIIQPTILSLPLSKLQSKESMQKTKNNLSLTNDSKTMSNIYKKTYVPPYNEYQQKITNNHIPHLNGIMSQLQSHDPETLNSNHHEVKTQSFKSEENKSNEGGIHSLLHSQLVMQDSQEDKNIKPLIPKSKDSMNLERNNHNDQYKKQGDGGKEQQIIVNPLQEVSDKVQVLDTNNTLKSTHLRKDENSNASKYKPMKQTQDQSMELLIKQQILEPKSDEKLHHPQYDRKRSIQDEFLQMHALQLYKNSSKDQLQSNQYPYKTKTESKNGKEKYKPSKKEANKFDSKVNYENINLESQKIELNEKPTLHWNPARQCYIDECIETKKNLQSRKEDSINEAYIFGKYFFQNLAYKTQLELQADLKAKIQHIFETSKTFFYKLESKVQVELENKRRLDQLPKACNNNTSINENIMNSKLKLNLSNNLEQSILTMKVFFQKIALQTRLEMIDKPKNSLKYEGLVHKNLLLFSKEILSCKQHAKLSRWLEDIKLTSKNLLAEDKNVEPLEYKNNDNNSINILKFEFQNPNNKMLLKTKRDKKDFHRHLQDQWFERQLNLRPGKHFLQEVESYIQREIMMDKRSDIRASIIQRTSLQAGLDIETKEPQNDHNLQQLNYTSQSNEPIEKMDISRDLSEKDGMPKVSNIWNEIDKQKDF